MHPAKIIATLSGLRAVLLGGLGLLAAVLLAAPAANADIALYSSSFGGSSATDLNGTAVTTAGATLAQHTQYGTSATATWSAATAFKADGSFAESGTFNSTANRASATLAFTPQDGYVYHLTMTTSFTQLAPAVAAFHAMGFFESSGYTGNINLATGADVWALTRPGDASFDDQVAHYNVSGGGGNKNAIPTTVEDTTAPSTLRITLDTTGGSGNWSATYYVGNGSGGFTQLASVADLDAVTIGSAGIAVYNGDGAANFQSFELSVVGGDTPANPLRIMPMGDSITVGYTNADWTGGAFEFGYRSGLYTLLSNDGYDFRFIGNSTEPWTYRDPRTTDPAWPPTLNLGTLGQDGNNGYAGKTASFLNTNIASWLASQDPDIILLKIGTNSLDQSGLQTLVNTITTTEPACHLIIAQIMPKYTYQQDIVNYNTWIRDTLVPAQQALGRKVTVVDQYAPFLTNPADLTTIDQSLFSNAINHPSNPGYDKMAQVWFDAIEALGIGPGTYSHWIRGFSGVGGQTGLNDDPDGDGLKNGIENFFGTNPGVSSSGVVAVSEGGGIFTFIHPQNATPASDLTAAYTWSKDLATFLANGATDGALTKVDFTTQADTPSPGITTVTATVTGTVAPKLFVRLHVTQP